MKRDTDEILLNFTPEQYEKYLSLLKKANGSTVTLDFDVSEALPCMPPCDKMLGLAEAIEIIANELLTTRDKNSSFFSPSLTKNEIEALAALYYRSVTKINAVSTEISSLSLEFVKCVREAEAQYREKVKIYQDFLPYLAALHNSPHYQEKIAELDDFLYKNAENALCILKKAKSLTDSLEKTSERIIPVFLAKSGRALGLPPYDDFSAGDFYASITNLIEQLKNEKRAFFE